MAVTLRFLGQASKQAPQVLTALTPRASVSSAATPRTPLRAASAIGDKSPFFAGEASPFFFDNDASTPRASGFFAGEALDMYCKSEPLTQMRPMQMMVQKPRPTGAPSGTLLQRLSVHASDVHVDIVDRNDTAESSDSDPENVRQAVLSRRSRVAQRGAFRQSNEAGTAHGGVLLGRETHRQNSNAVEASGAAEDQTEEQMAQAARALFLRRKAVQSGRSVAARM